MVKHTVQLKLPKLWGKKRTDGEDSDVVTEVDLDKEKYVQDAIKIGVPLVIGLSIGYLVGFKAGVHKGGTNVIMMKD